MEKFAVPDKNDSFSRVVLDGKERLFRFSYNYMAKFWTIGLYKDKSTPIVGGIKVVPGFPLNYWFSHYLDLPNGLLFVRSKNERVLRNDFKNGNAEILYMTVEEAKSYAE